jgi:DNA-binding NtrC family response regulator
VGALIVVGRPESVVTILCIDDDRNILEIHRALLESKGYRVVTAIDGPTGIALSRHQSIDVVVLDFKMPGMDGEQVAQVLMQEQPTLPVVIWSGDPDGIPESLRWFAYAVLQKSDGLEVLLSVVESLVKAGTANKTTTARRALEIGGRLSA